MTREEAIDLLDNLIGMVEDNHKSDYDMALQMAIQALEQEPKFKYCCDRCGLGSVKERFCPYCGKRMTEPQTESEDKE